MEEPDSTEILSIDGELRSSPNSLSKSWVTLNEEDSEELNLPELTFPMTTYTEKDLYVTERSSSLTQKTSGNENDNLEDKKEKVVESEEAMRSVPETTGTSVAQQQNFQSQALASLLDDLNLTEISFPSMSQGENQDAPSESAETNATASGKDKKEDVGKKNAECEGAKKPILESTGATGDQEINKLSAQVYASSDDAMTHSVGIAGPGTLPNVLRSSVLELDSLRSNVVTTGEVTEQAKPDTPLKVVDTATPATLQNSNADAASAQLDLGNDDALKPKPKPKPKVEVEVEATSSASVYNALVCPICKDELTDAASTSSMPPNVTSLPCSHTFHADCLRNSLDYAPLCPVCRTSVNASNDDCTTNKPSQQPVKTSSNNQPSQTAVSARVQPSTSSSSKQQPFTPVSIATKSKSNVDQSHQAKSPFGLVSRLFQPNSRSLRYLQAGYRIDILNEPKIVDELRATRNMPSGEMQVRFEDGLCVPGYSEMGCIVLMYTFPNAALHAIEPGTPIIAYLPNVPDAHRIVSALQSAFEQRWTFFATGVNTRKGVPVITWGPLTHKTELFGENAPTFFSYPDNDYLMRLSEELRALGLPLHGK